VKIIIEGELEDVDKIYDGGYLPMLDIGRREYYVARDEDQAGEAAAKYWREMAEGDHREFIAMIGEERLVDWAIGRGDSFGISGLEDFLERVASVPEEQFASYDGNSLECSTDFDESKWGERYHELLEEYEAAWIARNTMTADEILALEEGEDVTEGITLAEEEAHLRGEDKPEELVELEEIKEELEETAAELGFDPTVAYRHN
jgi:hypothetical protein